MPQPPGVIQRGIRIKGEVHSAGDVVIEGEVDGKIHLEHNLLVETNGAVNADVSVSRMTIAGRASGTLGAREKIELKASAVVSGELRAPSVVIENGAHFTGTIHMDVGIGEEV